MEDQGYKERQKEKMKCRVLWCIDCHSYGKGIVLRNAFVKTKEGKTLKVKKCEKCLEVGPTRNTLIKEKKKNSLEKTIST